MEEGEKASSCRYIALDIHKYYSVVAGVDREGEEILPACRVEHMDLEDWLKKHLLPTDRVVIESTTNAWHVYDLLEPLVAEVLVANPIKVKQIACARVKTDKKDTFILARLLAANLVPTVWVPPKHVRELRQLISHRRRMAGMHTQVVNRMHSVAHRHHLNHPKGKDFQPKNTLWQQDESLSRLEKMQLELDMETREHLEKQIERMTRELGRMSHEEPWASDMLYLMQIAWLWGGDGDDDPGSHRRHHPFRDTQGTGELFWPDAWAGAKRSEVAWQGHHEGRAAGTALGDGGSGLASGESRPALEEVL